MPFIIGKFRTVDAASTAAGNLPGLPGVLKARLFCTVLSNPPAEPEGVK
jgi:hypothetical protein